LFSVLTSFSAGLIACFEVDLKKLVAISTLSQLGLMIYVISLGERLFCFFHMVSHALFKALLFLSCGFIIIVILGAQDIRFIGAKSLLNKNVFFIIMISNLRLCGFPFLSGFFSKDLIIE